MKGKFIPEIPGENVSYPGKKIPRPGPTRNKITRPGPTRNKITRPDPTRKYSLKCSPTPDRFRSGPVRSGETRGFGLPRRSLLRILSCYFKIGVVVVLRSPIHANEPSEYNGMLYRTSNRVLNNGIKVIILICMDGTSQYHHYQNWCKYYGRVTLNVVRKLPLLW